MVSDEKLSLEEALRQAETMGVGPSSTAMTNLIIALPLRLNQIRLNHFTRVKR